LGDWGVVLVVCVCVSVWGVVFSVGVCVCDLLICLHDIAVRRLAAAGILTTDGGLSRPCHAHSSKGENPVYSYTNTTTNSNSYTTNNRNFRI